MDSLISPKQPDGFKTESPIRSFTDFQVSGQYAIGKGFRPSMAHLSRYLDAMEAKEGWALVQIILPDNDAADPTILFRKTVLELTSDMAIMPEVVDLTIRKIVIGLGQLRDDMIGQAEARMEDTSVEAKGFLSEAMDQYADRAAGYAAELAALVPVHGAEAVMRQMIAHHGEAVGRAIRKHPALGAPYGDDPVNPKHYDGTACADIGERMTANGYQVLKYCWRLGKKDDPIVELDKALWYLKRERGLIDEGMAVKSLSLLSLPDPNAFFAERIAGQDAFVTTVARLLWEGYRDGMNRQIIHAIRQEIESQKYAIQHRQSED